MASEPLLEVQFVAATTECKWTGKRCLPCGASEHETPRERLYRCRQARDSAEHLWIPPGAER